MKKVILLKLIIGLMLILTACPSPPEPSGQNPSEVIIPLTTKVADDATKNALTDFNLESGLIRFAESTALLESLELNDVIVSEPNGVANEGYLRKVTGISREGRTVLLETTQASLDQAVAQGSLNVERDILPSDIVSSKALLEGVSIKLREPTDLDTQGLETQGFGFNIDFNQVLVDADGNNSTKDDQLSLNGSFAFSPKLLFDVDIKFLFKLQKLKLGIGFEEEVNLALTGFAGGSLQKEIAVAQFYTAPITFFIGPVPVVLTPKIDIKIGVDGQIGTEISMGIEQSLDVTIGAEWKRGSGWNSISGVESNGDYFVDAFALSMVARAYASAEASILLYGIAGPFLYGRAYAKIDVAIPRDPLWELSAGLEAGVGFEVEILSFTLVSFEKPVLNYEIPLGQAENSRPSISITAPSGTIFDINKLVDFEAEARDPEDGECFFNSNCNITWSSSKDGTFGSGLFTSHGFPTGGVRTITATVTDSKGKSSSDSVTVSVVNSPPSVFISEPTNQPLWNDSIYLLVGGAIDANEQGVNGSGTLPCTNPESYVWSVEGGDQILGGNKGCQLRVRFKNPNSNRNVTLTATDPQGASSSKTISIAVGETPDNPAPEIQTAEVRFKANNEQVVANGFHTGGSVLTLSASATDLDGDPITYSWSASFNGEAVQTIGSSANLDFDPRGLPNAGGDLTIVLSISDGTTTMDSVYTITFRWFLPEG